MPALESAAVPGLAEPDEDEIVARIFGAIVDQRLPPGTKLSEAALCEAFGVGRMRIRQSLLLLASREVVDLVPNRGAFVASPSAEQARDVFETRLMIEPALASLAAERAGADDIARLERHLAAEHEAHAAGRRRDAIRLSGEFHGMLARIAGNAVALRLVEELVTRTSLIIGIFGGPGVGSCRDEDHGRLCAALRARDAEGAAALMTAHLRHIRDHLDLGGRPAAAINLVSVLRG